MSSKQGHETLESYTDSIKVKISERYKPPPRINLAMTYAQRLTLNKQIQDNIPQYDFSLENTILERMKQWKVIRGQVSQDRQSRSEKIKEEFKKKEVEKHEQEQLEEMEVKTVNETATTTNPTIPASFTENQSYINYSTNSSILIPTKACHSNILTPVPLHNYGNQQYSCKQVDKSPINISDFENDTSSPFDNMALKSINDMEELAQVLNKEDKNYKMNTPMYSGYQNTPHLNYTNYLRNDYSYNIPNSVSYVQSSTDYSQTNGYYYSPESANKQSIQVPYSKPEYHHIPSIHNSSSLKDGKKNCKSVPDIMKELEADLANTQISKSIPVDSKDYTSRPKSTDLIHPRTKIKSDEQDENLKLLSLSEQEMCRSISMMGFPLPRVARICKAVGNDKKKIVDHLLALADLLDLGFSENDVSKALIECDNDRDKALDLLIS